mmetsp:Transcript_78292/g.135852  ORF Transcript_78292/g.135852 Transcript_78292/m.135852 type:complete len:689 (+) Transcript_78292:120-2186(+)
MSDYGELGEDGQPASAAAADVKEFFVGDIVKGLFLQAHWYLATVAKVNGDGTYEVEWDDGDEVDKTKKAEELKLVRRTAEAASAMPRVSEQGADELAAPASSDPKATQNTSAPEDEEDDDDDLPDLIDPDAEQEAKSKASDLKADGAEKAKEKPDTKEDGDVEKKTETQASTTEAPEMAEKDDAEMRAQAIREVKARAEQEARERAARDKKAREVKALMNSGGRQAGIRVRLKDMTQKPEMNGVSGTLVEQKGDRWIVNLDGGPGVGKGRWMVNARNLVASYWQNTEPKTKYYITGSWNSWVPVEMTWDADRRCLVFDVKLSSKGTESFQILVEKDPNKCIYPDTKDANPHVAHKIKGPDFQGHGQNWTIGKHAQDKGKGDAGYEVQLFLWEDESVRLVAWEREKPPAPEGAASADDGRALGERPRYCVAGTWSNWAVKDLSWDEQRLCYYTKVQLGAKGWESFQILLDGDYNKTVYPDRADACPHVKYNLCGPDSKGHGKNWTIGKHTLDKGAKNSEYTLRVSLNKNHEVRIVTWEPYVEKEPEKEESSETKASNFTEANRPRYYIAGSWSEWKITEMKWDAERQCYFFRVRLGKEGWESFQILLDSDYKKCVHPDRADACPYEKYTLCGPDDKGHGKNWTIGRHALDKGSPGACYEVRLVLSKKGQALVVDWEPLQGKDWDMDEVD